MQQIERYGVIALVLLLVTIVAISFWGDSKSPGFWSRLVGKGQPKKELVVSSAPAATNAEALPLTPNGTLATTDAVLAPLGAPPGGAAQPSGFDQIVPVATQIPTHATSTVTMPGAQPGTLASSPSTIPSTPPAPATGAPLEYVVKRGDSLAKIAAARLGDEQRWTEIQALNPTVTPKNLAVGQTLKLPAGARRADATPGVAGSAKPAPKKAGHAGGAYVVKKGDSLRAIAAAELGDAKRWREIAAANPLVDPHKLAVGQKLRLPASERAVADAAALAMASNTSKPRVR